MQRWFEYCNKHVLDLGSISKKRGCQNLIALVEANAGILVDKTVLDQGKFFLVFFFFFFQAEDGIRDTSVTGVQTCALPISHSDDPVARAITFEEYWEMQFERRGYINFTKKMRFEDGVMSYKRVKKVLSGLRSEERRVGKECRYGWGRGYGRERGLSR